MKVKLFAKLGDSSEGKNPQIELCPDSSVTEPVAVCPSCQIWISVSCSFCVGQPMLLCDSCNGMFILDKESYTQLPLESTDDYPDIYEYVQDYKKFCESNRIEPVFCQADLYWVESLTVHDRCDTDIEIQSYDINHPVEKIDIPSGFVTVHCIDKNGQKVECSYIYCRPEDE